MAFGRKVMRGMRKRMAQDRRRRRLSNIGKRKVMEKPDPISSERDRLNERMARANRKIAGMSPYRAPTDAELRKGNKGSRVTPIQDRGPRRAVDPIKTPKRTTRSVTPVQGRGPQPIVDPKRPSKPANTTGAKHSGQGRGGRGGIPAVASRGPQMIVDPLRPSKPATIRAKHSGEGRGGRGGIPDVNPFGQRRIPRSQWNKHLKKSGRIDTPYFKGGNVTPTKNAIGTNDYRKTGTTLSVKDNRKKTK